MFSAFIWTLTYNVALEPSSHSSDIRDIVGNLDGGENEKTHNFMIGQTALVWQMHTHTYATMMWWRWKNVWHFRGVILRFFVRSCRFFRLCFVGAFLLFRLLQLVIPYKCDQRGQLYYIFFCFYSQFGVYTHRVKSIEQQTSDGVVMIKQEGSLRICKWKQQRMRYRQCQCHCSAEHILMGSAIPSSW